MPRTLHTTLQTLAAAFLTFVLSTSACAENPREALAKQYSPQAYQAQRIYHDISVMTVGDGPSRAYVFIPRNPARQNLPVILFHHGWLGMNPKNFGGLIDVLVRKGNVVIYPVYQDGNDTAPQLVTNIAGQADAAALARLKAAYPGLIDTDKALYIGFSMGATISLNLAIDPAHYGLPTPRALMLISPGDAHHVARGPQAASIIGHVETLPATLPTVVVSGFADTSIGVPTARAIATRMCHLSEKNRLLIFFPSDSNGSTHTQAGHGSPGAPDSRYDFPDSRVRVATSIPWKEDFEPSGSLNLLDYYGYWRIATTLADFVASGSPLADLFDRQAPANHFLGFWPDGTAYTAPVLEDPCLTVTH